MGQATLKVPPQHVYGLRLNVYARLGIEGGALDQRAGALGSPDGRDWHKLIRDEDSDKEAANEQRFAVGVLESTRNIAALVAVMDQLDWTDDEDGDEALEITADAKLLECLLEGYLVDLGGAVHDGTDEAPTRPEAVRYTMKRIEWVLTQREVIGATPAAA